MALSYGAIDTLRHLLRHQVRLALVTNGAGDAQRTKIDRFRLGPLFDYILVEGEFGTGKPDERVYGHALEQLDSQAAEAWMVGDNLEWDVGAPQRLGIFGIWFNPSGSGLPVGSAVRPDCIIRELPELIRVDSGL
jgi:putative hydrolase of the HAD superfamily